MIYIIILSGINVYLQYHSYTYWLMLSILMWVCIEVVEGYFEQVEQIKSNSDDCSPVEVSIFVVFQS